MIRNFDDSTVAVIENDSIIDYTGHPIGSIERSEHLRWDREKLFPKFQKKPVSHFLLNYHHSPLIYLYLDLAAGHHKT